MGCLVSLLNARLRSLDDRLAKQTFVINNSHKGFFHFYASNSKLNIKLKKRRTVDGEIIRAGCLYLSLVAVVHIVVLGKVIVHGMKKIVVCYFVTC